MPRNRLDLRRSCLALLLGCMAIQGLHAETVVIPIGSQADRDAAGPLPQLGANRATVRARWGDPVREHPPVGDPPIQRWEYPGFDVYFEYDHVLHAVVPHKPRADIVEHAVDDE